MAAAPVARPSRPSARLEAFDHDAITSTSQITASQIGSCSQLMSRRNDTALLAGVRPWSSGNWKDRIANDTPTAPWQVSLARLLRPSDRALEIFVQSSAKPTAPSPVIR